MKVAIGGSIFLHALAFGALFHLGSKYIPALVSSDYLVTLSAAPTRVEHLENQLSNESDMDEAPQAGESVNTTSQAQTDNSNRVVSLYSFQVRSQIEKELQQIEKGLLKQLEKLFVELTIEKGGSLAEVKLVNSVGTDSEQLAIHAVKRAQPFPPLPSGSEKLTFVLPVRVR